MYSILLISNENLFLESLNYFLLNERCRIYYISDYCFKKRSKDSNVFLLNIDSLKVMEIARKIKQTYPKIETIVVSAKLSLSDKVKLTPVIVGNIVPSLIDFEKIKNTLNAITKVVAPSIKIISIKKIALFLKDLEKELNNRNIEFTYKEFDFFLFLISYKERQIENDEITKKVLNNFFINDIDFKLTTKILIKRGLQKGEDAASNY